MTNSFVARLGSFVDFNIEESEALERIVAWPRPIVARRDIIREGDRPGPLIVILEGWAFRYKILPNGGRQVMGYLMPGDACDLHAGLMAEMDHSIQTITRSMVVKIERPVLDRLIERYPKIATALYLGQLVEEGTLRAWITSIGRRASLERVAHLMCEIYVRAKNIGLPVEPDLVLPLSQILLADSLGMTPVHLNRILRQLRLAGAMCLHRGKLVISDPVALARIAGFDENYLHRRPRLSS